MLDIGETWTYSAVRSAAAGQSAHVGSVVAQGNGQPVAASDSAFYFGAAPAVTIQAFVNSQDVSAPTGPILAAGDMANLSYVVANAGNVPLSAVVVNDDNGTPGNPADDFALTLDSGDNGNGVLDLGESWMYFAQRPVAAGQNSHVGSVAAQANGQPATASDSTFYFGAAPAIAVQALINGQDANSAPGPTLTVGDAANFEYLATNPGNVPLSGVYVVDDNGTPANSADDFNAAFVGGDANNNELLDVGETWMFAAQRIVVLGQHISTATAGGNDITNQFPSAADAANYFGVAPATANADFNTSGSVDGADFLLWQIGFGKTGDAELADGDATGDQAVDDADLAVWNEQFGGATSVVAASAPLLLGSSDATLVAAGLVDVGAQPAGNLTGKIFYINGGHGYAAANTTTGQWSYGRPLTNGIVEDLGNQDQMTFFADYLFRAGATIVPMRPVGNQPNEVVMDNDDPGVTFIGAWTDSLQTTYFGSPGDVPYRYAATSGGETAVAKYTPNIPSAGFYPVYTWVLAGSDRAADQLYRINHAGGSTEVKVNHRAVGTGMVYLGTYYFEAGTGGSVEVSNRSSEAGRVVIADMIRFGNGMGDTDRGAGVSGRPREDELSLYWIMWQVDNAQGVSFDPTGSSLDMDSNVSVVPRYARFMNREAEGSPSDRVLISFHTNASGGGISNTRGVLGLYNGNNRASAKTPNQFELASALGQEVNDDMVAQAGQFEFNWFDSNLVTLDRTDIEFGEINNESILDEFDATIVEVAYHDNATDAALLRDPKVRDAVARATYQGAAKFLNSIDGGATSLTMLPGRVTQVRAESLDADSVQITWTAPAANSYNGDAPTGYRIYGSTNGYGFDGGTFVAGGATTSFTFNGLSADEGAYYFKVVAVNSGGEGEASEVVAAIPGNQESKLLIVNGFDRLTRQQNPTQAVSGGTAERVRPRQSNSYDYAVQVAAAIEANAPWARVDTASNEMVASGAVNLADYKAIFWISGEESSAEDTFNPTEQTLVTNYLAAGGKLFVSGAEIAWDLDNLNNGRAFYENELHANYAADDANVYTATGVAGSIFAGLSMTFDNGALYYNVDFPDVINPNAGSTAALAYGGGAGNAGVQYTGAATGAGRQCRLSVRDDHQFKRPRRGHGPRPELLRASLHPDRRFRRQRSDRRRRLPRLAAWHRRDRCRAPRRRRRRR